MSGKRKSSNSKRIVILLGMIVSISFIVGGSFYLFTNKKPYQIIQKQFIEVLEQQNYKQLTGLLTEESIKVSGYSGLEIAEKYQTIFKGLGIKEIKAEQLRVKKTKTKNQYDFTYQLTMETTLGPFKATYQALIVKEQDGYKIKWTPSLIFPQMSGQDKVLMESELPTRGVIKDRHGSELALNQDVNQIGIVPSRLAEESNREEALAKISQELNLSVPAIEKALSAEWAKGDVFVPLKVVIDEVVSIEALPALTKGLVSVRYYPLKEAAAHLIGYTGPVTGEDLEQNPSLNPHLLIGKTGLEYRFDQELRGIEGGKLIIVDANGQEKAQLLSRAKQDGKDLSVTIDSKVQMKSYNQLLNVTGGTVVMEPLNGDILALVSSPSFNPNQMANGISEKDYQEYANNPKQPFLARYVVGYAPGSTFKTITAAIGIDVGVIKPTEFKKINGLKWQKTPSWGDYWVTRVSNVPEVNLESALVYSDNIYFAQEGLAIGEKAFRQGLEKFNFTKKLALPIAMKPAQISNKQSFDSELLLADTAYGQGELLINLLQQGSMYSVFANQGRETIPNLIVGETRKEGPQVITAETANLVKEAMIKVVSDPKGTAHSLATDTNSLAAKTGTAEVKEKQDITGLENSFLVAFDSQDQRFLVVSLVEHYQNNQTATAINQELLAFLSQL